jgi:hypothetical protein
MELKKALGILKDGGHIDSFNYKYLDQNIKNQVELGSLPITLQNNFGLRDTNHLTEIVTNYVGSENFDLINLHKKFIWGGLCSWKNYLQNALFLIGSNGIVKEVEKIQYGYHNEEDLPKEIGTIKEENLTEFPNGLIEVKYKIKDIPFERRYVLQSQLQRV